MRVLAGDHEYMYSLTLPQLWEADGTPPPDTRRGIPRFTRRCARSTRPVAVAGAGGRRGPVGGVAALRPLPATARPVICGRPVSGADGRPMVSAAMTFAHPWLLPLALLPLGLGGLGMAHVGAAHRSGC